MNEVHDLVYHGGGGFIYSEVWQMPIMTRRYHIRKINEFLQKKAEAEKNAMSSSKVDPRNQVARPNIPDFTSKVKKS